MTIHINDILITIRQSINSTLDGFETSFNECTNKTEFINLTFQIIQDYFGWDPIFDVRIKRLRETDPSFYFFNDVVKNFLYNPFQTAFRAKQNTTDNDKHLITLFTKFALLKALFECLLKNPDLLTQENFSQIKMLSERLKSTFYQLPSVKKQQISVNGEIIIDINQLEDITVRHRSSVLKTFAFIAACSLSMSAVLTLAKIYEDQLSENTQTAISIIGILISLAALYKMAKQWQGFFQLHFLDSTREQLNINSIASITANDEIKRFFIINNADLETLQEKLNSFRTKKVA